MGTARMGNINNNINSRFNQQEMTQELKEQIRVVAEYDGWIFCNDAPNYYPDGYWSSKEKRFSIHDLQLIEYHTSYDSLIPVAKKVCNELEQLANGATKNMAHISFYRKCLYFSQPIKSNLLSDISDLFNAVYAAIVFLNAQKEHK